MGVLSLGLLFFVPSMNHLLVSWLCFSHSVANNHQKEGILGPLRCYYNWIVASLANRIWIASWMPCSSWPLFFKNGATMKRITWESPRKCYNSRLRGNLTYQWKLPLFDREHYYYIIQIADVLHCLDGWKVACVNKYSIVIEYMNTHLLTRSTFLAIASSSSHATSRVIFSCI